MGDPSKSLSRNSSKFHDEDVFEDLKQDTQISLPDTSHLEGVNYLFGHPIAHSLSPLLHQTVYGFFGASVTMPHKIDILPFLDESTEEVRDIGACNTIYMQEREGKKMICSANTDCFGVRDALLKNLPEGASKDVYRGRPGLIVGRGGSCRSAIYALRKWLGCHPIYVVNRDAAKVEAMLSDYHQLDPESKNDIIHVKTTSQAEDLPAPKAIVSCIPNITPETSEEVNARSVIETFLGKKEKGAILEMCYHPTPWTEIAVIGQEMGWQVILGTECMIYQGLEQDTFWTGKSIEELPKKEVQEAIAKALEARRNATMK